MYDIYGLAAVHLQPQRQMSWDELAVLCERPPLLWRALGALVSLVSVRASFPRAKGSPAPCDMSGSEGECRSPA